MRLRSSVLLSFLLLVSGWPVAAWADTAMGGWVPWGLSGAFAPRIVTHLDYSDPTWVNERFDYGAGWAGKGFGLTGTQRGAPESMALAVREGRTGLALNSVERDESWYQANPGARHKAVYAKPDKDQQDDLFLYSEPWLSPAEEPQALMRVYLPAGNMTSLRMPAIVKMPNGELMDTWPGLWVSPTRVDVRLPIIDVSLPPLAAGGPVRKLRHDIRVARRTPVDTWVTLGLKVLPDGDMAFYFAEGWVAAPFLPQYLLGSQRTLNTDGKVYPLVSQKDATLMSSNFIREGATVIGEMLYAKARRSP